MCTLGSDDNGSGKLDGDGDFALMHSGCGSEMTGASGEREIIFMFEIGDAKDGDASEIELGCETWVAGIGWGLRSASCAGFAGAWTGTPLARSL